MSRLEHIEYIHEWESYIWSREQRISWGYQKCEREHSKAMSSWIRYTGMWSQTGIRGENYTIDIRVDNWWHLCLSAELGFGNLGSHSEVVNAMLQGLMSSEVELGVGVMREVWQGLELAKIYQQCHMSVIGCNKSAVCKNHPKLLPAYVKPLKTVGLLCTLGDSRLLSCSF